MVSALLTRGPLARAELTDLLDVSRSRLSPEVGHADREKGCRARNDSTVSTGGRRATRLVLGIAEFGVVAGVDIDAGGLSLVLMQLDGTVVSRSVRGVRRTRRTRGRRCGRSIWR